MFFKNTVVAIAIFVSSALGAITFTSAPSSVVAGQTYNLKWSADGSGVSLCYIQFQLSVSLANNRITACHHYSPQG